MCRKKIKKIFWRVLEIGGPACIIMSIFYGMLNPPSTLEHANQRILMYIWSTVTFMGMYKLLSYMNQRLLEENIRATKMIEVLIDEVRKARTEKGTDDACVQQKKEA